MAAWAQNIDQDIDSRKSFMPSTLFKLDPLLSHHVIIVDKNSHQLFIYENKNSYPVLLKTYSVATGKFSGDKMIEGDKKTPEGIYLITHFRSSRELLEAYGKEGEIYGAGAFVLNYPNPIDTIQGKTGHGIWLHSTNDNSRISIGTDSKGCVVTTNEDLADISRFVELGKTPLVITQNNYFFPHKDWMKRRREIQYLLNNWINAWRQENLESYLSFYHPEEYSDNFRKNYRQFKNYKRIVFSGFGKPQINISNVSIIKGDDYLLIQFVQNYQSQNISDTGRKTLYLKQDSSYQWKIVHETWGKLTSKTNQMVFTPSQRFFPRKAKK